MPTPKEVEKRRLDVTAWYESHRYKCKMFEQGFERHLTQLMQDEGLRDARVETRTKTVESLAQKACKASGDLFKYQDPQREITDSVGARVMVPLVTDIALVSEALRRRFVVEEESDRGEEEGSAEVPGYRSLHLLVRLGDADLERREFAEFADMMVEIQIRTILQHAWAALQHDLGYKADRPPSPAVRRRITALAGLLELADREFVEVKNYQSETERHKPSQPPSPPTSHVKLSTAALRVYVERVMDEEDTAAHAWYVVLLEVINRLGVESTDALTTYLGGWREHAPELTRRVRNERPWANSALVFDLMLRLSDSDRYLDAGFAAEGRERTEVRERGFQAELAPYLQMVR